MYVCGFTHACKWIKIISAGLLHDMHVFYRKPVCLCSYIYKTMKPICETRRWGFTNLQHALATPVSAPADVRADRFKHACQFVNLFFRFYHFHCQWTSPMLAPLLHRKVRTHWFPAATGYFLVFLHLNFHIHLLLILCQGSFWHSWSLFPLLWKSQGRMWLWSDHLSFHVLPRCVWVSSKCSFFRDDGRRPQSDSRACSTLSALSFSWFSEDQHSDAHWKTSGSGPRSPCCLWWVLMTPSFRAWELTSRRWGDSLCLCCHLGILGRCRVQTVFIQKTPLHKLMEHDIIVFRVKLQDQEPREEAADAP